MIRRKKGCSCSKKALFLLLLFLPARWLSQSPICKHLWFAFRRVQPDSGDVSFFSFWVCLFRLNLQMVLSALEEWRIIICSIADEDFSWQNEDFWFPSCAPNALQSRKWLHSIKMFILWFGVHPSASVNVHCGKNDFLGLHTLILDSFIDECIAIFSIVCRHLFGFTDFCVIPSVFGGPVMLFSFCYGSWFLIVKGGFVVKLKT